MTTQGGHAPRNTQFREAVDEAKRAQLARLGGYNRVERDAYNHDLQLAAQAGDPTAPLLARITHLEHLLHIAYTRTYQARRSRDMWKARAMNR